MEPSDSGPIPSRAETEVTTEVTTVHIVFKTHLDVGFTDLARNVVRRYVEELIPQAVALSRTLEEAGGPERFIWTTGSWLVHYYLQTADVQERSALEQAIRDGHIVWHGLPFTTHTEVMDRELFEYGLSIAAGLDERFGRRTIAAKMTDVPGHTIALVPPMAHAGLNYLHLGKNHGCRAPDVPPAFVWRAQDGSELVVNYSRTYGGVQHIAGMEDALVLAHTGDNRGPQTADEVRRLFQALGEQYPAAEIRASTLDAYAEKVLAIRDRLPVVEEEMGDSWIHGVASDPGKVARYRELLRLRRRWLQEGRLDPGSPEYDAFSSALIHVPEHTWGVDIKTFLADFLNYAKTDFAAARERDLVPSDGLAHPTQEYLLDWVQNNEEQIFRYSFVESSWQEQSEYVDAAVAALGEVRRAEADAALQKLTPARPQPVGAAPIPLREPLALGQFDAAFDVDGAICALAGPGGRVWADDRSRLGAYRYETFGWSDYQRWYRQYHVDWRQNANWLPQDYAKPGFEFADPAPRSRTYTPILESLTRQTDGDTDVDTVLARLRTARSATEEQGAPRELWIRYSFPREEPVIDVALQWFGKDAHRMPEASWFSFAPLVNNPNRWRMDKMGCRVSPLDVVKNGNRNLHGVESGLFYEGADGRAGLLTLDAPLVSMGAPRLLRFDNTFADLSGGFHFCLHNNVWGTNFRMWYGEDARFRFRLRLEGLG